MRVDNTKLLGTVSKTGDQPSYYLHPLSENVTDLFESNLHFNKDKEFDIVHGYGHAIPVLENSSNPNASIWEYNSEFNWRTDKDDSSLNVSPSLHLSIEQTSVSFGYQHETTDAIESVIKKGTGGVLEKVNSALEMARSANAVLGQFSNNTSSFNNDPGKFISRYKTVPAYTGSTAVSLQEIKLNFYFGQAGLFDAYKEVVYPIMKLAALNAPELTGNKFKGPVPTVPYMVQNFVTSLATQGVQAIEEAPTTTTNEDGSTTTTTNSNIDTSSGASALGGISSIADSILTAAYTAYDNSVQESLKSAHLFSFRFGRAVFGPCLVKGVDWSFDFSEVDNNGYPTKGSISLKDVTKLTTASTDDIYIFNNHTTHRSKGTT